MIEQNEKQYSERQLEVIKFTLLGLTRVQGAEKLEISEDTFNTHLKTIFLKAGVHSTGKLNSYLCAHGFAVNAEMTEVTYLGKLI